MMLGLTLTRTANAGVLLEMDGKRILLDGVCKPLAPYLGTPNALRESLTRDMPDVLAFTHEHPDHYDPSYAKLYKETTLRPVYGPESLPFYEVENGIRMTLVETRHIGKADVAHVSYVLEGSACVWFMGDASPLVLKKMQDLPRPDVLILPFAYAVTPSAWKYVKDTGAWKIVLVHMPKREEDKDGIWNLVEDTTRGDEALFIPEIQEKLFF